MTKRWLVLCCQKLIYFEKTIKIKDFRALFQEKVVPLQLKTAKAG